MRNFLFGVATVFITQGLILLGQLLIGNRARKQAAETAMRQSGVEAVERVMGLLNDGRKLLGDASHDDHAYDDDRVYDICHDIKAAAVRIPDEGVRDGVTRLTNVLWYADSVAERLRYSPRTVGHLAYNAGLDMLGAWLRNEDVKRIDTESTRGLADMMAEADLIELQLNAHLNQDPSSG